MSRSLFAKIEAREPGIFLYGLAPPKRATSAGELEAIAARQRDRLGALAIDGVVVYDIQDEAERIATPRPFPFLPTVDPDLYAHHHLAGLAVPRIVYRCVGRDTPQSFLDWLATAGGRGAPAACVLVGAPSGTARGGLALAEAYALARSHAPELVVGGVAIAERHGRRLDEHQRLVAKVASGCRFFVSQAVYDVTSTKSLLSDWALAHGEHRGDRPVPIILTFAPCGSEKTLAFMKWLGIGFPRWLENELRFARDPLATSVALCERIFAEVWDYAHSKGIPVGVNVESVSVRKTEIEASVELLRRLRLVVGKRGM